MPFESSPVLTVVAPAATFMFIMNARQARIGELIRRNSQTILDLVEDGEAKNALRIENLREQDKILIGRHSHIMSALQFFLLGLFLVGLFDFFAPAVAQAWFPDLFWPSWPGIFVPGLAMLYGVYLTWKEMREAPVTLKMEHDFALSAKGGSNE